jgi:predicted amidohydrolase YtcJ
MKNAALCLVAAALTAACRLALAAPEMIVVNGKVFTADPAKPAAQAIAVEHGRISAVGSDEDVRSLAGPGTRIVDAGGRRVVPGLTEAHVHMGSALPLFAPPVKPIGMPGLPFPGPTPEQALQKVHEAAQGPGDWITAFIGPTVARDPRNWRAALDEAAGNRPTMLRGFWGHALLLNSAALARLGITDDVVDPLGGWWGRDDHGHLDGAAYETAQHMGWSRVAPVVPQRLAQVLGDAASRYARWGVTSIHLMNNGKTLEDTARALSLLDPRQKWTVYSWGGDAATIRGAWDAIDSATRLPARMRVDGPKWLLDGTPIEQLAFQREPYPGRGDWRGRHNFTEAQERDILRTALSRPQQLILHVVGDGETDRLFDLMEATAPAAEWAAKRVRLEHGDGIRPDTLARAARLGVVVTINPLHFIAPLPDGRPPRPVETLSPVRSLLKSGIRLAIGSDAGGDEVNPFLNMMLACTYAANPSEALTREEALMAYTAGGAYVERQETVRGRIAPGMAADLAILSQDVLEVSLKMLPATRSVFTLVDGEVAYEDREALR